MVDEVGSAATGDVRAWMEKLDRLINDKNLTHPRVFYAWCETRELMEEALTERDELRSERQLGEQTQECLDPSCSVLTVGVGYKVCPRCGGELVPA